MKIQKHVTPSVETYELLQRFYAPFNLRLAKMLNDNKWLDWEDELVDLIGQKQKVKSVN